MRTRHTRGWLTLAALHPMAAICGAGAAHAESPHGYYAALSVEADDADFSRLGGAVAVPLGQSAWAQLDLATTSASLEGDDVDTALAGLTLGFSAGRVDYGVEYTYLEDGSDYTQHDFEGGFTYIASRGSVGLDLFYRNADYETIASIQRRFRDPLAVAVTETTEGTGIGVHGDIIVLPHVTLFGSAMTYDYDNSSTLPARLARLQRIALSGVTRDQAFLRDSINVGITYGFSIASLSAVYYRDSQVEGGAVTDTGELAADFPLGEPLGTQWMLATWIGYSVTEQESGLTYGGARISVVW
jgi:hypothetical protein